MSKTYMTSIEGENTRLRHYLARLHRKTLCYSKSVDMLKHSIRLLTLFNYSRQRKNINPQTVHQKKQNQ